MTEPKKKKKAEKEKEQPPKRYHTPRLKEDKETQELTQWAIKRAAECVSPDVIKAELLHRGAKRAVADTIINVLKETYLATDPQAAQQLFAQLRMANVATLELINKKIEQADPDELQGWITIKNKTVENMRRLLPEQHMHVVKDERALEAAFFEVHGIIDVEPEEEGDQ